MGTIFEELIRKFAESSNETSGEHFTPKEVIRLMVNLLFLNDEEALIFMFQCNKVPSRPPGGTIHAPVWENLKK